jgi:uncharacterized membrane protein
LTPARGRSRLLTTASLARGAFGGALIGLGASRRGAAGFVMQALGAAIAAATVSPTAAAALKATGARRRWVDARRTFFIALPVMEVFRYFSDFENFKSILTDVESVVDFDDGRSRWTVRRRGESLVWNATVTKWVPGRVIAWQSVDDAPMESAGLIRFAPAVQDDAEGTCVEFQLCYRTKATTVLETVEGLIRPGPPRRAARDLERLPRTLHTGSGGAKLAKYRRRDSHPS